MPTATRPRTQTHSPRTEVADKLSTTPSDVLKLRNAAVRLRCAILRTCTEVTSNPNVTPTAVLITAVATPTTPSTAPPRPTQTGPHHTHTRQGTAVRATPSAIDPTAQRPPATTPPRPHPEPCPASPTAPQHHHAAPPLGHHSDLPSHRHPVGHTLPGNAYAVSGGSALLDCILCIGGRVSDGCE